MKQVTLLTLLAFLCLQFIYAQPGRLDPSFGHGGIVTSDLGKPYGYSNTGKQVLAKDGSIFLVVQTGNESVLTKRHANGSIDTGFGFNGFSANVTMSATTAIV